MKGQTASIRFTDATERDRIASRVFDYYRAMRDPDDPENPEKCIKSQTILTVALCSLGREADPAGVMFTDGPDSIDELREIVVNGVLEIKQAIGEIGGRIDQLQANGVLSAAQAAQVKEVVDFDPERINPLFASNIRKSLRGGKVK